MRYVSEQEEQAALTALLSRFPDAVEIVSLQNRTRFSQTGTFSGGIFRTEDYYFYADASYRVTVSDCERLAPVCLGDRTLPPIHRSGEAQPLLFSYLRLMEIDPRFQKENPFLMGVKNGKHGVWALDGRVIVPPLFDAVHCFAPVYQYDERRMDPLCSSFEENSPVFCPAQMFLCDLWSLEESFRDPAVRALYSEEFLLDQLESFDHPTAAHASAVFDRSGALRVTDITSVVPGSVFYESDGHGHPSAIRCRDLCVTEDNGEMFHSWIPFSVIFPEEIWWQNDRYALYHPPMRAEERARHLRT